MSNFFRNIPLTKTTPLVLTVIFTVVVLFFLSQFNLRAAKKPIKDLFTNLDGKDYEKAYHQYSEKAQEIYSMSLADFKNIYKGTTKHEILSITTIREKSLSKHLNQNKAFMKEAQGFSFQDYQNKKLFRVKFYTENPETDVEVYEDIKRYCSIPGIVVDSYFGVVQMDAFTWKILFIHILGSKCKGKNKYAEYEAELKRKQQEEAREKRKRDIKDLISTCEGQTSYEAYPIPDYNDWDFFGNYSESPKVREAKKKRETQKIEETRKKRYDAILAWDRQKGRFCTCLVQKTFPSLSPTEIEYLKNSFWADGTMWERARSCKAPDLYKINYYVNFKPDIFNTNY